MEDLTTENRELMEMDGSSLANKCDIYGYRLLHRQFSAIHALCLADNGHLEGSNKQDLITVDFLRSGETCYGIRKGTLTDMQESANINCISGSEAM